MKNEQNSLVKIVETFVLSKLNDFLYNDLCSFLFYNRTSHENGSNHYLYSGKSFPFLVICHFSNGLAT